MALFLFGLTFAELASEFQSQHIYVIRAAMMQVIV